MSKIQDLYDKIKETKKEIKNIGEVIRDSYLNDETFKHLQEEQRKALGKRKEWELHLKESLKNETETLETLKLDLENDRMLLADMALTKVQKGEEVIVEDKGKQLEIIFSVKFKK